MREKTSRIIQISMSSILSIIFGLFVFSSTTSPLKITLQESKVYQASSVNAPILLQEDEEKQTKKQNLAPEVFLIQPKIFEWNITINNVVQDHPIIEHVQPYLISSTYFPLGINAPPIR